MRSPVIFSESTLKDFTIQDLTIIQNGSPDNKGWNAIDLRGNNNGIRISNVKITDVTGACIAIRSFSDLIVEDCVMLDAFTGITVLGGSQGVIKNNRIVDMGGDGVFPQILSASIPVYHLSILDNYIENTGDTGIDITSNGQAPPHMNITASGNTLVNSHVRISNAIDVYFVGNTLRNGKSFIDVDSGAGRPINILIQGNKVDSARPCGIGLFGAENCVVIENEINMLSPSSSGTQSGISAAVWGDLLIEDNIIRNAADYGIDFGNWAIGNNHPVIRGNTITNFGVAGIFDNTKKQGPALIEHNTIQDTTKPYKSDYGIWTAYEDNKWTIKENVITAGSIAAIKAPSSTLTNNQLS
ncbi:right-handed parallel beta-helix repeat-containing protein [Candidatus Bathyarchaeota archaeon]|nr:MAG: right-handed parallel beta-helix repeat-containing protein [Candidatus Bathyarchaeota archaeon]